MFYCLEEKSVGEIKIDKILDVKFINKETGEVMMAYPGERIIGGDMNLTMAKEDLKEFMDYEAVVAEDDDWGQWHQDTVDWLLKPFDVGDIEVRSEDDEVWKDMEVSWISKKKVDE